MRALEARDGDLVAGSRGRGGRLRRRLVPARIHHRPIARRVVEASTASHIVLRDLRVLGVVRLWGAEEGLEGDEGGFEGEHGGPGVFEDVEADCARGGGDVRVVDFCEELHFDGLEGVGVGDDDVLRGRGGGIAVALGWGRRGEVRSARSGAGEGGEGTYDLEGALFVGGAVWAGEGADEVEGRAVDEVDGYIGGLVVLAVCTGQGNSQMRMRMR